jgi:hypothetical protein
VPLPGGADPGQWHDLVGDDERAAGGVLGDGGQRGGALVGGQLVACNPT